MPYKPRSNVINVYDDHSSIVSEANITPKQILQRLPIALAQVKAGNNSENLLNEMRKIAYSLYKSR